VLVEPRDEASQDILFGDFLDTLAENETEFVNKELSFQLFGEVDDHETMLGECIYTFTNDDIQNMLKARPDQQVQLSGYCAKQQTTLSLLIERWPSSGTLLSVQHLYLSP